MSKDYGPKHKDRDQLIEGFLKGGEKIKETKKHLPDDYLNEFRPLEVRVSGYYFDRAFKTFRSLVQKDGILSEYKQRQAFEKPSVKRRRKRAESIQKQKELESKRLKILSGEMDKEIAQKQKQKEAKRKLREEDGSSE